MAENKLRTLRKKHLTELRELRQTCETKYNMLAMRAMVASMARDYKSGPALAALALRYDLLAQSIRALLIATNPRERWA
jgi:hypothetical protein